MKLCFVVALMLLAFTNANKKIVCYWQALITADIINPDICTHIIYTFLGIDGNGDIFYLNSQAPQRIQSLRRLQQKNPNLQIMVAVGGANEVFSEAFSKMAKSTAARSRFVVNTVNLLNQYSLNGVDIDWEYPTVNDRDNFEALLMELKESLSPLGYILSIAAAPDKWRAREFYNIKKISEVVDFINLMTYDFHGTWNNEVGHHAQFYPHRKDSFHSKEFYCAASVNYWLSMKAPASKLVLGIPTYGNMFTLLDDRNHKISSDINVNQTKASRSNMGFDEYCKLKPQGWKQNFDSDFRVFYSVNKLSWFGFDSSQQIIAKVKFAKSLNLGGVMFWSIDTDDHDNACRNGKFSLISSAAVEIGRT